MASSRATLAAAAVAAVMGFAAMGQATAFLLPGASRAPGGAAAAAGSVEPTGRSAAGLAAGAEGGWGCTAAAAVAIGAHVGLAVAAMSVRSASVRRAAEGKEVATKYVESATDQRLFEQVYTDYTIEYLKGPMYWHEDKLQGIIAGYPGEPMKMDNKLTSNNLGNLKTFSSNELAFLAFLFFGIGLYGNLMFNLYDPQWLRVATGNDFNVSYIVESLFLPISFFFHIACYIQRKNGK